jgi:hypothetical protein
MSHEQKHHEQISWAYSRQKPIQAATMRLDSSRLRGRIDSIPDAPTKRRNPWRDWAAIALVAGVVSLAVYVNEQMNKVEVARWAPGAEFRLAGRTHGPVTVARSKALMEELVDAAGVDDKTAFESALLTRAAFLVAENTKVRLNSDCSKVCDITVLEGKHTGEQAWVPNNFLQSTLGR